MTVDFHALRTHDGSEPVCHFFATKWTDERSESGQDSLDDEGAIRDSSTPVLMAVGTQFGSTQGSHPGEDAFQAVVDFLAPSRPDLATSPTHAQRLLRTAFQKAEYALKSASSAKGAQAVGITLTIALLRASKLFVAHAGADRCYVYDGRRLKALTRDHTLAQKMFEAGVIDRVHASNSKWRNVLQNVISSDVHRVTPSTYSVDIAPGSRILLCTRELHRSLADYEVRRHFVGETTPEAVCSAVVQAAANRCRQQFAVAVASVDARFGNGRPHPQATLSHT